MNVGKASLQMFIFVALLAPMLEETAFRGLIQTSLLKNRCKISPNISIVITSTLFTLVHISNELGGTTEYENTIDRLLNYFSLFILGISTGFIKKKGLLGSIAFHAGANCSTAFKILEPEGYFYISNVVRSYLSSSGK